MKPSKFVQIVACACIGYTVARLFDCDHEESAAAALAWAGLQIRKEQPKRRPLAGKVLQFPVRPPSPRYAQ